MKMHLDLFSALRKRFAGNSGGMAEETDNFFNTAESTSTIRDRSRAKYRNIIDDSLRAWRDDPLSRRIVCLTTQFSIGRGFRISADSPQVDALIHEFWDHPLNRMDARL